MNTKKRRYQTHRVLSCIAMVLALLWLTVCLPYVNKSQQAAKAYCIEAADGPEEDGNPLTNTTEEKAEGGLNTLSEYLHDGHLAELNSWMVVRCYKCYPSNIYFSHHPDLFSPPPEA